MSRIFDCTSIGAVLGAMIMLCVHEPSAIAAEVYYADAEGVMVREERIDTATAVFRGKNAEIRIQSPSVTCRIRTRSLREAKKIQSRIANDSNATIQCFGKFKSSESTGAIEIETASFSMGHKEISETLAVPKTVATDN